LESPGQPPFRKVGKALARYAVVLLFMTLITDSVIAQITLRGMVLDSTSKYSLPDVNITIKNTGPGTVSDLRGSFELKARAKDTIVFSRVGYQTRMLPAEAVNRLVLIFMKEETRMLDEVEIKDHLPSWLPPPTPISPWQNPTFNKAYREMPGFQGVQTFGPGRVFKMPGSGFKKEARAKERLNQIAAENDKAREYIDMVNSPEIKDTLMEKYGLSEEKFYEILARFNQKNGDFIYKLEGHEVLPLLLDFFAEEAKNHRSISH
jgi:hypothetical protein